MFLIREQAYTPLILSLAYVFNKEQVIFLVKLISFVLVILLIIKFFSYERQLLGV